MKKFLLFIFLSHQICAGPFDKDPWDIELKEITPRFYHVYDVTVDGMDYRFALPKKKSHTIQGVADLIDNAQLITKDERIMFGLRAYLWWVAQGNYFSFDYKNTAKQKVIDIPFSMYLRQKAVLTLKLEHWHWLWREPAQPMTNYDMEVLDAILTTLQAMSPLDFLEIYSRFPKDFGGFRATIPKTAKLTLADSAVGHHFSALLRQYAERKTELVQLFSKELLQEFLSIMQNFLTLTDVMVENESHEIEPEIAPKVERVVKAPEEKSKKKRKRKKNKKLAEELKPLPLANPDVKTLEERQAQSTRDKALNKNRKTRDKKKSRKKATAAGAARKSADAISKTKNDAVQNDDVVDRTDDIVFEDDAEESLKREEKSNADNDAAGEQEVSNDIESQLSLIENQSLVLRSQVPLQPNESSNADSVKTAPTRVNIWRSIRNVVGVRHLMRPQGLLDYLRQNVTREAKVRHDRIATLYNERVQESMIHNVEREHGEASYILEKARDELHRVLSTTNRVNNEDRAFAVALLRKSGDLINATAQPVINALAVPLEMGPAVVLETVHQQSQHMKELEAEIRDMTYQLRNSDLN